MAQKTEKVTRAHALTSKVLFSVTVYCKLITMDEEQKYFNTKEAANFLRIGKTTLIRLRHMGEGPAYIQHSLGSQIVYTYDDLVAWMDSKRKIPMASRIESSELDI